MMSFVVEGILVGTKYHNACNRMNNGLTKIASQDISTCSNITTNKNLKKKQNNVEENLKRPCFLTFV